MSIDLPQAHINFYHKHGHLELEEFLPKERIHILRSEIKPESTFSQNYLSGRDLWRKSLAIRQLVQSRPLAKCAAMLSEKPSLQLGFDQLLCTTSTQGEPLPFEDAPITLNEISNVTPLACGLIINLSENVSPHEETTLSVEEDLSTLIPIPKTPGSLLFFRPEAPLDFKELISTPDQCLLLIAYANVKPLYIQNERDPHKHFLKQFGYGAGDHLSTKTHPLLIK